VQPFAQAFVSNLPATDKFAESVTAICKNKTEEKREWYYFVLLCLFCVHFNQTTTCSAALKAWEARSKEALPEAKVVKMYCQIPPITKLDNSLNNLKNCEYLFLFYCFGLLTEKLQTTVPFHECY
jgi:hypothetical protein